MEVAVIGLGKFGSSIAINLAQRNVSVTIFDISESKVNEILDFVEQGYVIDSTDEKALQEIEIQCFDKVIIALGKDALNDSLLTALNLKEMNVKHIIAKATSDQQYKLLKKIGVDYIVQPERDMGKRIAIKLSSLSVVDYIEVSEDVSIENILVNTVMKKKIGKTIHEINLRKYFKVNIISIARDDEIIMPERDTKILKNDVLMVIGKIKDLEKFEKHFKIK